ncbi:MarR family transcriptional regulator [Streptomyces sp. SID3915]|uniref:MarR family transcriptional regulator n=1 Tax=Streptomyces sp. SID3915 TaxID=2690263 RepID=UPI0013680A91|nr:MarR family transcriptional regulator [Streptomyces sp. SID3915]
MATENLGAALRTPPASRPYARAHTGYGKRTAPGQRPAQAGDFALLPERERYVAGYVDRLPDGGAMDVKSLAKALPLYGQMAVGSALRALGVAGHLRRVRCQVIEDGQSRWVTRTFWSRTARDSEWWDAFPRNGDPQVSPCAEPASPAAPPPPRDADAAPAPAPVAQPSSPVVPEQRSATEGGRPAPSPAYLALARLGRGEPRLALSAADCAALEELPARGWTGVDPDYLTQALTAGLPPRIGSPVGFVRRRLTDKIPPRLPAAPTPPAPGTSVHRVMMECTECGVPGPPEALPDGLCRSCRTPSPSTTPAAGAGPAEAPAERDVHALVGSLRDLMRAP